MIVNIMKSGKGEKLSHLEFSDCGLFTYGARPITGDIVVTNDGIEYKVTKCLWSRKYKNMPTIEFTMEETGMTYEPSVEQQIRNFLKEKENMMYEVRIGDEEVYTIKLREHNISISAEHIEFGLGCGEAGCLKVEKKVMEKLKEERIIK